MDLVLLILAILVSLPMLFMAGELALALIPPRRAEPAARERGPAAVVVPAHNEEAGIEATVRTLLAQLRTGDRVLVVADNCSDATADNARRVGAEVIERRDDAKRGKGYALAFGIEHLKAQPPEVISIVDADCEPQPGAMECILSLAAAGRTVQGAYHFRPDPDGTVKQQTSDFSLIVKNLVRPLGLSTARQACLLTGTGMAFPWRVLAEADLASGNIVEDMKLGIDLAIAGHPPQFAPDALFLSDAAPNAASTAKQRTRWEHGHVSTLISQCPRLFLAGLTRARLGLWPLAMELGVPPVSLLLAAWSVLTIVCLICWQWLDAWNLPFVILTVAFASLLFLLPLVWLRFGRGTIRLATLMKAPLYVLWKVPIYLQLIWKREKAWVRTERQTVS